MSERRAPATGGPLGCAARACAPLVIAAAIAATAGCASSRGLLTSPDDYAAYRATRTRATLEGRLAAAAAYLERFPNGAFVGDVRAYLERAEPIYFAAKRGTRAGLQAYLATLPSGAFTSEATARLRGLERERDAGDLMARAASEAEARLARQQAERRRVREEPAAWLARFLSASIWDRPLSEAPAELVVPFSLSLPSPVCRARAADDAAAGAAPWPVGALRCAKLVELPYAVTEDGEREAREATLEIAVLEDASGRPIEATIGGPDLFARLEEARSVHPVAADDPAARIAGISQAAELARGVFGERVSDDPACRKEAVAPVVLHLSCGGLRLVVRAGIEPGSDDTLTIGPEKAR